jgi:hypothetical protein
MTGIFPSYNILWFAYGWLCFQPLLCRHRVRLSNKLYDKLYDKIDNIIDIKEDI